MDILQVKTLLFDFCIFLFLLILFILGQPADHYFWVIRITFMLALLIDFADVAVYASKKEPHKYIVKAIELLDVVKVGLCIFLVLTF